MTRKIVSLDVAPAHEPLLSRYAAFLEEMDHLAATAPDGAVLSTCEDAVIEKGREQQRLALQRAVQARLDLAEKRGPR